MRLRYVSFFYFITSLNLFLYFLIVIPLFFSIIQHRTILCCNYLKRTNLCYIRGTVKITIKSIKLYKKRANRGLNQSARYSFAYLFLIYVCYILDNLARHNKTDHAWHEGYTAGCSLTARVDGRLVRKDGLEVVDTALAKLGANDLS